MMRNILGLIIGIFLFQSCAKNSAPPDTDSKLFVVEVDERNYRLHSGIKDNAPEINNLIAPYKAQLDETMDEVISTTPLELIKDRPNGSLNNWVADLLFLVTNENAVRNVDFSVQNYGGVRVSSLPRGNITVRNIYELMPFDNKIAIVELDGKDVINLFEIIVNQGGWPVSKQILIYVDEQGNFVRATINGESIEPDKTYLVSMPDFIANGNSGCTFLIGKERHDLNLMIRDGMIDYLRSHQEQSKLHPTLEKRIINE